MTDEPISPAHFRRAGVDEAPAILRVLESAFDRWPAIAIDVPPIDHLRWKMTPPGYPQDQHAVIDREGEIVGVQLRWLGAMAIGDAELPFDYGVDMSVHQSARGQRLGSLLRDSEAERLFGDRRVGFDTISVNQQVVEMYEDRGPVRRALALWVRPLTPRLFVATHRAAGPVHLVRETLRVAARRLRAISPIGTGSASRPTIEAVTSFDARADALWTQVRREYQLARVRHADWLNWRYLDRRAGRISAFQATEGDRLLGYAAFRANGTDGRVLDLVTAPDTDGVGAALLERGVGALRAAGCLRVDCLLPPGHREEASLAAAGFSATPSTHAVQVTRARNQAVPEIIEVFSNPAAPIHLMYGDFDHG